MIILCKMRKAAAQVAARLWNGVCGLEFADFDFDFDRRESHLNESVASAGFLLGALVLTASGSVCLVAGLPRSYEHVQRTSYTTRKIREFAAWSWNPKASRKFLLPHN